MKPTIFLSKLAEVASSSTSGYLYFDTTTGSFSAGAGGGSSLPWSAITGAPTTLAGYGITDAVSSSSLLGYAPLASPAFTGIPTAPTPANGTNTNEIATTAFVLANAVIGSSSSVASVPVGTILPFTGTTAPAGFLLCPAVATNISRTTYSYLFAVLGTTWGAGDGSTTFGIPFFPTGYTTTAGVLGTSSVGQVLAHSHPLGASVLTAGGTGGTVGGSQLFGVITTTSSTGGSINQAAGVNVKYIIAYLPNNGIATSLSSYTPLSQSFGLSQTWQDMTASRIPGTTYYNTTGKPITILLFGGSSTTNFVSTLTVSGINVGTNWQSGGYAGSSITAIIPIGASYSFSGVAAGYTVSELR